MLQGSRLRLVRWLGPVRAGLVPGWGPGGTGCGGVRGRPGRFCLGVRCSFPNPQALALVGAVLYALPPGLVVEVPLYGFA